VTGMLVAHDGDVYRVQRETREARIELGLDFGPRRESRLQTGIAFFDHMLEMLGWWGDLVLDASFEVRTFRLQHVVCEDVDLALGAAAAAAVRDRIPAGVESSGFAHAIMDEATAFSAISFEGRSAAFVARGGAAELERVEDMLCVDLVAFFEGLAQGARAVVHLRLESGADPHHAWEAGFRAFARALRAALQGNPWRAEMTAGVEGTLD
jgi:imidazoleglycerol phosphate dehydratase HisB